MLFRTAILGSPFLVLILASPVVSQEAIPPVSIFQGNSARSPSSRARRQRRLQHLCEGDNASVCEVAGTLPQGKRQPLATEGGSCLINFRTWQTDSRSRSASAPRRASTSVGTRRRSTASTARRPACLPRPWPNAGQLPQSRRRQVLRQGEKLLEPLLDKSPNSLDLRPRPSCATIWRSAAHSATIPAVSRCSSRWLRTPARPTHRLRRHRPVAVEEELRVARATRTNWRLCSAPSLRTTWVRSSVGPSTTSRRSTARSTGLSTPWRELRPVRVGKDAWRSSKQSRARPAPLHPVLFAGDKRKARRSGVLWIDSTSYPDGAIDEAGDQGCR